MEQLGAQASRLPPDETQGSQDILFSHLDSTTGRRDACARSTGLALRTNLK